MNKEKPLTTWTTKTEGITFGQTLSKIEMGNFSIYVEKRFNWFNKLIFKLLFGLKVEDVSDE